MTPPLKVLIQRTLPSLTMTPFYQELISKIIIQQDQHFDLIEPYKKDRILNKDNTAFRYHQSLLT
jgi:hypothetical protein